MTGARLKILYVTAKGGVHDYRFLKKMVEDYDVLLLHYAADELIEDIKKLQDLRIISKRPLVKSFPIFSELFHFKKIYNQFKPDIVHTGYVWQVGILASFLNIHPHLSMVWGSDILIDTKNNFFIKKIVKKVINQCDHIQCDAEYVKFKTIKDYNVQEDKITVFPWGIDLGLFKKKNKSLCREQLHIELNKFVVIFNRYLEPVYGIMYLLEGFKKFCENKDDVMLLLLSDGSLKNEAKKFITRNQLDKKIKFVGKVPNHDLPLYLGASDVYISTSLSDGTPLSLLEAIACGLGLIVTDLPAVREWVSDQNGFIIPQKNSDAVSDALEKCYNNRNLTEKQGEINIKIAKERADWNKNYLKLKEIYNKISRA